MFEWRNNCRRHTTEVVLAEQDRSFELVPSSDNILLDWVVAQLANFPHNAPRQIIHLSILQLLISKWHVTTDKLLTWSACISLVTMQHAVCLNSFGIWGSVNTLHLRHMQLYPP